MRARLCIRVSSSAPASPSGTVRQITPMPMITLLTADDHRGALENSAPNQSNVRFWIGNAVGMVGELNAAMTMNTSGRNM